MSVSTSKDFYGFISTERETFTSRALEPASLYLPTIVEVNDTTQARGQVVPISALDEFALVELDEALEQFIRNVIVEVRETLILIRARQLELAPPLDLFSVTA